AEIPFTFFFYLSVLIIYTLRNDSSIFRWIFAGIVLAVCTAIKSVGVLLLCVFIFYLIYNNFIAITNNALTKTELIKKIIILIISYVTLYIFISQISLKSTAEPIFHYFSLIKHGNFFPLFDIFQDNYFRTLKLFFYPFHPSFFAEIIVLLLFAYGYLKSVYQKRMMLFTSYVFIYVGLILFLGFTTQGFRYMLPIIPLFYLFATLAVKELVSKVSWNIPYFKIILFVIYFGLISPGITKIIRETPILLEGPYKASAQETFDYIKQNTPKNSIIVFNKPRVIALFAERNSFSNNIHLTDCTEELKLLNHNYIVLYSKLENIPLKNYINKHNEEFLEVWNNEEFQIYKKK
ncbi:MAG: hypothetical protein SNJ71_04895, partial [Bacteroidales bacterium]